MADYADGVREVADVGGFARAGNDDVTEPNVCGIDGCSSYCGG